MSAKWHPNSSLRSYYVLCALLLTTTPLLRGQGTFTLTGSMTVPRAGASATVITGCNCPADGKVLVVGGHVNSSGNVPNTADLYDPATGLFTPTGPMNVGRTGQSAALLPGGKVLVVGGIGFPGPADAEIYDPLLGTFSCAAGTDPASGYCNATVAHDGNAQVISAVSLSSGRALITGLRTLNSQVTQVYVGAAIYDPLQASFTCINGISSTSLVCNPSMNTEHRSGTATVLLNGTVLIAGGDSGSGGITSAEIYDPAVGLNGTFVSTGGLLAGRYNHTATLLKTGDVLIAGGSATSGNLNSAEIYANGAFTAVGNMAYTRWGHTATLLNDGTVLVAGGCCEVVNLPMPFAEIYDSVSKTFSMTGQMNRARVTHTGTLLPDGRVLVAGGGDATAELYMPKLSITAVTPTSGIQGQAIPNFTVSGNAFDPNATISFSGAGIAVNSYTSQTTTQIVASISVASNATIGARDVVVTNANGQQAQLSNGFTVLQNTDVVSLSTACINGLQVDINGAAIPGASVSYIAWAWGDGAATTGFFPQSHTYSSQGRYVVTVTAHYNDGSTASASQTVTVTPGVVANCVALTITANQGGSVSYHASVGSGTVTAGSPVTLQLDFADDLSLTASPGSCNSFSAWSPTTGLTGPNGGPIDTASASIIVVVTGSSGMAANFVASLQPIPQQIIDAESQLFVVTTDALKTINDTYSGMLVDAASEVASDAIKQVISSALDKIIAVDNTAPYLDRVVLNTLKQLKITLATEPVDLAFGVAQDVLTQPIIFSTQAVQTAHTDFVSKRLCLLPNLNLSTIASDIDSRTAPVSATAGDVLTYKNTVFDPLHAIASTSGTVSTWMLIGGAGAIAKAVIVPVTAPVDLPVGVVAIESSGDIAIINTTLDVGNLGFLLYKYFDVSHDYLQASNIYNRELQRVLAALETGQLPNPSAQVTEVSFPSSVTLDSIDQFGITLQNTGPVDVDARLRVTITDSAGEKRGPFVQQQTVPASTTTGFSVGIPFPGFLLGIFGNTGAYTADFTADFGDLSLEEETPTQTRMFQVVSSLHEFYKMFTFGSPLTVGLFVKNNDVAASTVSVTDLIPQELVMRLSSIDFITRPALINEVDKTATWIVSLNSGESTLIMYRIVSPNVDVNQELFLPSATLTTSQETTRSTVLLMSSTEMSNLSNAAFAQLKQIIDSLPDSAFKRPWEADHLKKELARRIDELTNDVNRGEFDRALDILRKIRAKVDGDRDDWIVARPEQDQMLSLIDQLGALIRLRAQHTSHRDK